MKTVSMKVGDMNFTYTSSDWNFNISEPHNTADYIIFGEDSDSSGIYSTVYAKDGNSGKIITSGDFSAVMNNIIETAPSNALILIKSGKYNADNSIIIDKPVSVVGLRNVIIYTKADPGIVVKATSATLKSITIGNFTLWATASSSTGMHVIADLGKTINSSVFENIEIRGTFDIGILLSNDGNGGSALIYNNRFRNLKILNTGSVGLKITNLITTYNEFYGLFITDQSSYGLSYYGLRDSIFGLYTNVPISYSGSQLSMYNVYFENLLDNTANTASPSIIHNLGHSLTITNAYVVGSNPYTYGIYMANWNPQTLTLINTHLPSIAMRTDNSSKLDTVYIVGGSIQPDSSVKTVNYRILQTSFTNASTATFSGDGTTTQFSIAHGLVSTPSKVLVTPMSADAAGQFYVTADATNIYVNYTTAPAAGTDNVVLSWYAEV